MKRWPFAPLECGAYKVVYADPPWSFHTWSHRGQGKSASQHYGVMKLSDIKALPVSELALPDAALFLWVVQPMLPEAMAVLDAWGFAFRTVAFCWVKMPMRWDPDQFSFVPHKVRLGLGYHTRSGMEQCWLAIRGKGYKRHSRGVHQVLHAPIREHSRKPDEFRRRIELLAGDVPRVELFARERAPGWSSWGDAL